MLGHYDPSTGHCDEVNGLPCLVGNCALEGDCSDNWGWDCLDSVMGLLHSAEAEVLGNAEKEEEGCQCLDGNACEQGSSADAGCSSH